MAKTRIATLAWGVSGHTYMLQIVGTPAFHAGRGVSENTCKARVSSESLPLSSPRSEPSGTYKPRSSSGQDTALSRRQHRFDPGTGYSKRCTKCSTEKELARFNRRGDGWQSWCKDCSNAQYRASAEKRAKALERSRRWREQNPLRKQAMRKVGTEIAAGRLTRGFCELCGGEKADAHHWNGYDNPLDVQWLCRSCHVTVEPRRSAS